MVFVNDRKFACESCIKGHRSSSCLHTERPLFEVKKKGRPVSQCGKCRELRQAKRVHSKCTCNPQLAVVDRIPIPAPRPDKKPRRYMPSVPTLPNGISDAFLTSVDIPPRTKQWVGNLLNSCHCDGAEHCDCQASGSGSGISQEKPLYSGLTTLANAAAIFSEQTKQKSAALSPLHSSSRPCCGSASSPSAAPPHLSLPPILVDSSSTSSSQVPDFTVIPPLSTFESIAGTGCTCGLRCSCPGCIEHRGPDHAQKEHKDCKDGCGHCVDNVGGAALRPGNTTSTLIDLFFARAALLPNPPTNRRTCMNPSDVTVYPSELFSGSSKEAEERGAVYGLIKIPKLECCGGQCSCPTDTCQCGGTCNGGCGTHLRGKPRASVA